MKFSTSIITLSALCTADAFTVNAPKNVLQSLKSSTNGDYGYLFDASKGAPPAPNGAGSTSTFPAPNGASAAPQVTGPAQASFAAPASSIRSGGDTNSKMAQYNKPKSTTEVFDEIDKVAVQGGSLRTCSFDEAVDRVSVYLRTTGRPLNANVDLWQGPDNVPQKMSIYLEDGSLRPFRCTVESPGSSNAVAIRNTGQMEFPLTAGLECEMRTGENSPSQDLLSRSDSRTVQGGAVYTTPFPPSVQSVQVALRSDGRPLNARVELLQGPNNNKQVMDIYTEDGQERPFYVIIDTPGSGNVIRIVNTATVEFPLTAAVEPLLVDDNIIEEASTGGLVWS